MPENIDMNQPTETNIDHQAGLEAGFDHYVLNPTVSRFTVRVFATGLLSAFGHSPTITIRGIQGEVRLNPVAMEQSSLHFVVPTDSLTVADNISDKDRREMESEMRERVLEVSQYPQIVYDAPRVSVKGTDGQNNVVLLGQLTLHGVTRSLSVPAGIAITGDMLRAFGEFSLRQSDYNMKLVSAMGGALKVKDELKFSFDIVARKD